VRSPRSESAADRFLGVRLTSEELERLDNWRADLGTSSRSEAVRALLRKSEPAKVPGSVNVPVSLRAKLEEIVEDGWAASEDGALTLVLTLGFGELARLHAEKLPALRQKAREHSDRSHQRRRADREGRGLLER
jgi:hypothetical protein